MLCLSRRLGESVVIGEGADAVTVTVVSIDRGKIRLGVTAPREVPVNRREVHERIQAEERDGTNKGGGDNAP